MQPRRRAVAAATAALAVLVTVALGAPAGGAAGAPGPARQVATSSTSTSTTTTVPGGSTTTTTTTPTPTTEPGPGSPPPEETTTTLPPAPLPSLPPELAEDPRARVLVDPGPDDGGDPPVRQGPWDPSTNVVLSGRVGATRQAIADVRRDLAALDGELARRRDGAAELDRRLEALGAEARRRVADVATARAELRDHAVDAFITGRAEQRIVGARVRDPSELGVARRYLESVMDSDDRLLREYEAARDRLSGEQAGLADDVAAAAAGMADLESRVAERSAELFRLADELQAYEAGSHVYVRGFVFPVAGPVEFIDSWGFPRMTGTPVAHWHQGTDVFANLGTPLVAAESGRIARLGQASLGGNKLWVVGDSGTEYYYAHLSAFAAGVADGLRVNAGDVVGYVGDTGNARGTSPHLHFEIHPGGAGPVNPYPLLKAAYGSAPMVQVVVAPPVAAPPADPAAPPAVGG